MRTEMRYGYSRTFPGVAYDEAVRDITDALKQEGFGVLTAIDVKETLKQKLGVEFKRYQILGACNPRYAHQALTAMPEVGALLPCSIAVWEEEGGRTAVNAVDPLQTIAAAEPALTPIATEVRAGVDQGWARHRLPPARATATRGPGRARRGPRWRWG